MRYLPRWICFGLGMAWFASCGDGPLVPGSGDGPNLSTTSAQPSGPKGYGFKITSNNAAAAVAYGFSSCYASDPGYSTYELVLSPRMVDEMWNYLNWGGSVTLEVITQHTFTGDGNLSFTEDIQVSGSGITASFSGQDQASSPGMNSDINHETYRESITANDMGIMAAGGSIQVSITSNSTVDLGTICRPQDLGQTLGKGRGAVIRLEP